jgi:hypothetical protein
VAPCSLVDVQTFTTNLRQSSRLFREAVVRCENSVHIYHRARPHMHEGSNISYAIYLNKKARIFSDFIAGKV